MDIRDIAARSGYGVGTVSRVINDQPNVSDRARERILAVMAECGYEPNSNARYLKMRALTSVAAFVMGVGNRLFDDILGPLQASLAAAGEEVVVTYLDDDAREVRAAVDYQQARNPKAMVFLGGEPRDFAEAFHKRFFPYQRELVETKRHRNRFFLKSRQIGFTWFFAQEAFEDACLTGDNQIFLSATRAQAEVFRSYIVALAKEKFNIELKGNPLVLNTAKGQATLYFLSNNSKSAQSYSGHVYIDECFWIQGFNELYKVASGMASHKKWRRPLFSTPSAVAHQAYDLWTGERFQKRFKAKRAAFPSSKELRKGALCPDTFYRKVITLEDAIAGGCDLFDLESLKLEYSADEFRNLFLCEFVDDTQSVFRLADLETCYADTDAWPDFNPTADRPLGNLPVWGGYDPSRSRDDASFVIVAPPLKEGGEHRVIARYKWLDKSYIWQAERIRELVGRYNFRHIGVDVTGPGIGVFEQIRAFFPLATPINYSVQLKTQLVLKAKELIEAHRIKWDAGQNDIAHAFLTIRQGVTDSGQISYSASRTSATGHAAVAWAIMHALAAEPIGKPKGGCVVFIQ